MSEIADNIAVGDVTKNTNGTMNGKAQPMEEPENKDEQQYLDLITKIIETGLEIIYSL